MTEMIQLTLIREDGGTQARAAMSADTIEEYAAAMSDGVTFPPVTLFREGSAHWLGDGFHRVSAARKAGLVAIAAEVRDGGLRDARLFAIGANASHGLRRTNQDKRMAVQMLLQDPEWSQWSNREIAKRVGVSPGLVDGMRSAKVPTVGTPKPTPALQGAPLGRHEAQQEPVITPAVEPEAQTTADRRVQPEAPPVEPAPRAPEKAPVASLQISVDSPAFDEMRKALDAANARIGELEEENRGLRTESAELREENGELRGRISELDAMMTDQEEAFNAARRIIEAENRLEQFDAEIAQVQAMNKVVTTRNNGLMVENADLKQMLKSARRKNDRLEKAIKSSKVATAVEDEPGEPCMDPSDYLGEVGA